MNQAEQELKRIEEEKSKLPDFLYGCYEGTEIIRFRLLEAKKQGILLGLEAGRKEGWEMLEEELGEHSESSNYLQIEIRNLMQLRRTKLLGEKQ